MSVAVDVRPSRDPRYPAGPSMVREFLSGGPMRRNSAEFMRQTARRYGDLNHYMVFGRHMYQINHPDLIADFMVKDAVHHHRNVVMQRSRDVLGTGLLTSEEPFHMRQRRLAQPAFLRQRIAAYGDVISRKTMEMTERWTRGATRDVHRDMLELALRIVGKTLFDLDTLGAAGEPDSVAAMASAVDSFMSFLPLAFLPMSKQIQQMPIPAMRRLRDGKAYLDRLIYRMIAERRADPTDRGDLLSMLLSATDPEGEGAEGMTDEQLRDECVTIILAGHETTANALSFALWLLARHPEVQAEVAAEARAVLGEGLPAASDYPALGCATRVFAEAMRMYPPVWVTGRECRTAYRIAGYEIPVGAALLAPQYAVHRDSRFYDDPERFDPGRFREEAKALRPRYSYFPFAGGSRQCIAEGLAWMEGTFVLALLARDWEMRPAGQERGVIALRPAISLRPAKGVVLRIDRRR